MRKKMNDIRGDENKSQGSFDFFDHLNLSMVICRADDGHFMYANDAFTDLTGYTHDVLLNMSITEITQPSFFRKIKNMNHEMVAEKEQLLLTLKKKFSRSVGDALDVEIFLSSVLYKGKSAFQLIVKSLAKDGRPEQNQMYERLKESENLNRNLVSKLPHKVFLKDRDSVFITCNENFANDLGITPERIAGTNDLDYFNKEISDLYRADDQEVMNSGKTKDIVEKYYQNGEERWIHTIKTPFLDLKNHIVGVLGIFEDITEQKHAQELLHEREERFRMAMENIPDVIVIYDRNLRIQYVNAVALQLTGRPASYYVGKRDEEVFPPEIYQTYLPLLKDTLKTKKKNSVTTELVFKGNDVKNLQISIIPVLNDDGEVIEIMGITHDFTKYKKAEDALRESEEKYKALIEGMNETVWVIGLDGRLIDMNNKAIEVLGYSKQELIDIGIFGIDSSLKKEDIIKMVKNMSKDKVQVFETYHTAKNGTRYPVEIYSSLINYKREKAILSIARDITERKEAEQTLITKNQEYQLISEKLADSLKKMKEMNFQLDEARKKAEESDMLKSIFLANMSHEVRTPLNAIMGFSNLLDDSDLTVRKRKEYISLIINSGDRLTQIINDIIDFSKIESGQLSIVHRKQNIYSIIKSSYNVFRNSDIFKNKPDVKLILKLPAAYENLNIKTDKYRFQQVLDNLVSNAIKYTNKGIIEVGVKLRGNKKEKLEVYVKDTGPGISEEKYELIFQRFRQVEESTYHMGTGLGLSIAKGIVELLGGNIWFTSKVGKGSTFYFTIPIT